MISSSDIPPAPQEAPAVVRFADPPRFTLDGRRFAVDFADALPIPIARGVQAASKQAVASGKLPGFAIATLKHPERRCHFDDTPGVRWAKNYRHYALAGNGIEFLGALAKLTRESETGEIDELFVFGHGRVGSLCMDPNNGIYYPRNTEDDGYLEEAERARDLRSLEIFMAGPFPPVRFAENALVIFTGCNVGTNVEISYVTFESFGGAFAKRFITSGTVYAAGGGAEAEWVRTSSGAISETGWHVSTKAPWRKWVNGREVPEPWKGPQPQGPGKMTPPGRDGTNRLKVW